MRAENRKLVAISHRSRQSPSLNMLAFHLDSRSKLIMHLSLHYP